MKTKITFNKVKLALGSDLVITTKATSVFHKLIGFILSLRGNEAYMTQFVTVIGKYMAVPTEADKFRYKSSEGMHVIDLALLLHEHTHRKRSFPLPILWSLKYLLSPKFRANEELEAYKTTLLVHYLFDNQFDAQSYISTIPPLLEKFYFIPSKHLKNISSDLSFYFSSIQNERYREDDHPIVIFLKTNI